MPLYNPPTQTTDLTLSGILHTKQATDVASATTLTLTGLATNGNTFVITGANQIQGIVTTNWQDGDLIHLLLYHTTTGPVIKHASGAPGTNAVAIYLRGNVDWTTTGFDTGREELVLCLATRNGVRGWWEMSRVAGLTSSIPGFNVTPNSQAVQVRLNNITDITHSGITAPNLVGPFVMTGGGSTTSYEFRAPHSVKVHSAFSGSQNFETTAAVQTTDATVTTLYSATLSDNTLYWIEALVIGRDTAGTDRAFYVRSVRAHRQGAGVATLGTIQTPVTDETDAAWDCTWDVSTNDIRLRITGKAATTINWIATVRYQGVSGSA